MKRNQFEISIGIILIAACVLLSFLHWLIFRDAHTLFFYLMEDIVFLPIQVLLVTLVLEGLLSHREKQVLLEKLNMVIELFFSEVGVDLIKQLVGFDANREEFLRNFASIEHWSDQDFTFHRHQVLKKKLEPDCQMVELSQLSQFLRDKRNFMLRLLENPNLLEHETFTDLLWAVFHLGEEFSHLKECTELTSANRQHLITDIERAYFLLVYEWLGYMRHLKTKYPYLFSLAVRINPFSLTELKS